jgi:pimeloyl-ACP methyl ester carboxylesterase
MPEWEVVSLGGAVRGQRRPVRSPRVGIVHVDGYRATGLASEKLAELLDDAAEIVRVDLRGTGLNRELDLTWGAREVGDVEAAMEHLDPSLPVVFTGISIGAAIASVAAARLRPALLVAASPYDSYRAVVSTMLRRVVGMSEAMLSFHLENLERESPPSPVKEAPAAVTPALFLVGAEDNVVLPARTRRLAEAWAAPAEVWEFHASHTDVFTLALSQRRTELRERMLGATPPAQG